MREYIFWYAAGDHKHFGRFRHEELKALLQLVVGTDHGLVTSTRDEDLPYAIVRLESEEQARAVALRSVLTYGVFELWEHAESLEELSKRIDSFDIHGKENFFSKNTSFCARVRAFGKRFAHKEILEIIESVCSKLPFQGNVNLEDPDVQLWILLDYGHRDKESDLKKCFLTRKICKSAREHLLSKYALQKRLYLGTTSTKAELAFAMANQVHARPGSLILDPFAGTASILVACRAVGAFVFGADIDFRVLYGTTEPGKRSRANVFSNFAQYDFQRPELVLADSAFPVWRHGIKFDGICCDPPYGIRAGAKKIGAEPEEVKPVMDQYVDSHIPKKQLYNVDELLTDLLKFGAKYLKVSGRLAFLYPETAELSRKSGYPRHEDFEMIGNSGQDLAGGLCRRLISYIKIK